MPFVSFEGIDGSGKTTQVENLCRWLFERGERVVRTKEPDGGRLGPRVRALLTAPENAGSLSPIEELLLISAARYDHVRSVIAPALEEGAWVVSDRFVDSSAALQAFETEVGESLFESVSTAVTGGVLPDLTLILDLDPVEAAERRSKRAVPERDDPAEKRRDFERIRRGFVRVAERSPARCRLLDASVSEEDLAKAVRQAVVEMDLPRKQSPSFPGRGI